MARALDQARSRAENRVELFLDAARELISTNSGEFTVQEVVERSGQSLRTFYQYFAGKHELLLALFEESIRSVLPSIASGPSRSSTSGCAVPPRTTARSRRRRRRWWSSRNSC
jgi:AcrR family transcriptional regulator